MQKMQMNYYAFQSKHDPMFLKSMVVYLNLNEFIMLLKQIRIVNIIIQQDYDCNLILPKYELQCYSYKVSKFF